MKKENKNLELATKRGLAFVPFHKVRMSRKGDLLVYLNPGATISININYLRKVMEGNGES